MYFCHFLIHPILRAYIKTIQSHIKIIEKKYSVFSSSKIVVTLNKVAFFSHWMLLEGVLRMVAWKSWFPSRIGRIKLEDQRESDDSEEKPTVKKRRRSKVVVPLQPKTEVQLWVHKSKQNDKGAWANVPCKSIFVSYFNYDHFWVLTPSHGSRGPKDNFVFIVREWKWFIKFHCLKISWHFVSIGIVVLITSRKPNLPYQLWIRTHPYITSAYFWTFSDPPNHPTSA